MTLTCQYRKGTGAKQCKSGIMRVCRTTLGKAQNRRSACTILFLLGCDDKAQNGTHCQESCLCVDRGLYSREPGCCFCTTNEERDRTRRGGGGGLEYGVERNLR